MLTNKTKDYSIFKLIADNRARISESHVKKLEDSIKSRNLLDLRPILINSDFEVVDGQHRLMAAKNLGLEIYYQIKEDFKDSDIIAFTKSKSWNTDDYINYWCLQGNQEYIKLREFARLNAISISTALCINIGDSKSQRRAFSEGSFVFKPEYVAGEFSNCLDTIEYIKKMNGKSHYTSSSRFWRALLKLTSSQDYDHPRWMKNLQRRVERVGPRATIEDYCALFSDIYNARSAQKITL